MTAPPAATAPPQHQGAPIHPIFLGQAVHTLLLTLPIDPGERESRTGRRLNRTLLGLTALRPGDEIQVMICVQAMAAHHAADVCRTGPNHPGARTIAAARTATRIFHTMLRALTRRQAKPPAGRPAPRLCDDAPSPAAHDCPATTAPARRAQHRNPRPEPHRQRAPRPPRPHPSAPEIRFHPEVTIGRPPPATARTAAP